MIDPFILLATNPAEAAEGANMVSEIAGKFGVDWRLLIAQIINFCVVAYLLFRFAFKPILKTIDERQQKIADGLQYTEEMEQKLKDAEKQHAETIKKAQLEAKDIMDAAREQAKNYTEHQTQEAHLKAEALIKKAEDAMSLEKKQMLIDVRKEVANLVVSTSSHVLSRELSDNERERFLGAAAKELSSATEASIS